MCGIAGAFSLTINNETIIDLVQAVLDHQRFRGPDHRSCETEDFFSRKLVLGHNRLSIIDLSNEANQPFLNKEKSHSIIFNGEIYNYIEIRKELERHGCVFHTKSDTEVLLTAIIKWGNEALSKLNGMFSFAVLDIRQKKLFIARDRFGVKPLYYYFDGKTIAFASTAEVLGRAFKLRPNLHYLSKGLSYWVYEDDTSMTQYEKLHALRPGHFLELILGDTKISLEEKSYYDLRGNVLLRKENLKGTSLQKNIEEFKQLFSHSVELRLRADVKLGVSLSGGVDSSTVAAFVSQLSENVVGINYGRPDQPQSEGPLVKVLTDKLNIQAEYVWPSESEMLNAFWESFEAQESPIYGLSYIAEYLVYKRARELGIKVMVGGQGGDENFMGYRKYLLFYLRYLLRERKIMQAGILFKDLLKNLYFQRGHLKGYALSLNRYLDRSGIKPNLRLPPYSMDVSLGHSMELWERQLIDVVKTSVPTQLKSEDRNSMRNSIETRLPFMDFNVVEFGLALDTDMKIRNGFGKFIVRKATDGLVPNEIRWARYKRGFDVTQNLMNKGLSDQIKERLNDNYSIIQDFVSSRDALSIYTGQNMNKSNLLFQEAMTLLWLIKNIPS